MPDPEARPSRQLDGVPSFLREARDVIGGTHAADEEPRHRAAPRPEPPPEGGSDRDTARLDPASLPMPSLSRRRVVTAAGILAAALLTVGFARQVGEAAAATDRAEDLRAA